MAFLSVLGNLFTGGIFGSISGIVSHYITAKNKLEMTRIKYKHDLDLFNARTSYLTAQVAAGVKIQQSKTDGAIALADEQIKKVVYKQANKRLFDKTYMQYLPNFLKVVIAFMFANVDVLRAIIRPLLTLVFTSAFLFMFIKSYLASPDSYIVSAVLIVDFIIYIISAIISFYYMARDFDKHTDKLLSKPVDTSWHEMPLLEKEVENTMQTGYQPVKSNLNKNNPPTGGSGLK